MQSEPQRDDWLSDVLGFDAYVGDAQTPPTKPGLHTCRVRADDPASVGVLEHAGFRVVDVNMTLERDGWAGLASTGVVAPATPDQHGELLRIAGSCFRYSRFHLDPLIPRELADRVKREWVRSYVEGTRGVELLAAEHEGRPAGFLAVLEARDGARVIDLVGVASDAQSRGVGEALVTAFAQRHGEGRTLRVGTQAANIPSLRLYEKLGFRIASAHYVLHCHVAA